METYLEAFTGSTASYRCCEKKSSLPHQLHFRKKMQTINKKIPQCKFRTKDQRSMVKWSNGQMFFCGERIDLQTAMYSQYAYEAHGRVCVWWMAGLIGLTWPSYSLVGG